MAIEIHPLSKSNFLDYERLTTLDKEKPCYCSWWHIKPRPMDQYDKEKKTEPKKFRDCVFAKVDSGFHVGVLAYENGKLVAWISVGPVNEFYWAFKRAAQLQEKAYNTAAIMCFNTAPEFRGVGKTPAVLRALSDYGKQLGWSGIESYPFDAAAIGKHGSTILWPGTHEEYLAADYTRLDKHWLSSDEYPRSIFYKEIV